MSVGREPHRASELRQLPDSQAGSGIHEFDRLRFMFKTPDDSGAAPRSSAAHVGRQSIATGGAQSNLRCLAQG